MNDKTDDLKKPDPKPVETKNTPATPQPSPSARNGVPPLEFTNPPAQAVGVVFNTFRVGKKWAERVKIGDVVTLKKTGGEPQGEAEVVGVHTGSWAEVKGFAADNHEFGRFPPLEAAELLRDDLGRHYGSEMKVNSVFTVLYLKKIA